MAGHGLTPKSSRTSCCVQRPLSWDARLESEGSALQQRDQGFRVRQTGSNPDVKRGPSAWVSVTS